MKRYNGLYWQICSFENLLTAAYRARRGKRYRHDVAAFHYDLEANILSLQDELATMRYEPGPYHTFHIKDPKPRLISAAPYRDRVVHHAICQVIEPVFEPCFIYDSYANRLGKGTHKALDRCTYFARRYSYVLKCDIEKYFPSIDHEILTSFLSHKIKCNQTMRLLRQIVANSNLQENANRYFPGDGLFTPYERRKGIPIGNLTSQFFCNVYLDSFDHYVKQELRCKAYVRFADDFLFFSDDFTWLRTLPSRVQAFMDSLRLRIHHSKCHAIPSRCGVNFLGWIVYPDHRRLRRSAGVRFQRRIKNLRNEYLTGEKSLKEIKPCIMSWIGHLKHGDTWQLRDKLLTLSPFAI